MAPPVRHSSIVIRGMHFDSPLAAARAFGVSRPAIYAAIRHNTLDTVGLGQGFRARTAPITIRGVRYLSAAHAAQALGVSKSAIHTAAAVGRLDRVGLGGGPLCVGQPITVLGVTYPSRAAAAQALGVTEGAMRRLAAGKPARRARIRSLEDVEGFTAILMRRDAEIARERRDAINGRNRPYALRKGLSDAR